MKKYAVKYMQDMGSFEYSRKTMRELKGKAVAMIEALDGEGGVGRGLRLILDKLDVV